MPDYRDKPRNLAHPTEEDLQQQVVDIDREQAFMLFATFAGDAVRTGAALNVHPAAVLCMADECGWTDKLKSVIELRESSRPGDWERACNRAMNFVMAHQMRMIIDRALKKFKGMSDDELTKTLVEEWTDREGNQRYKASGKAYSDLAAAMEKVHAMTYHALNDTVQDRNRRKEQQSDDEPVGDMHAAISSKMQEVSRDNSPRAQLFDAQLAKGQEKLADVREATEVKARKKEKLRPEWQTAAKKARETFNRDPRMLNQCPSDACAGD